MRKRKQANRIITYGGIAAIAAIVGFMVFLQVEAARNNDFKKAIDGIALDTIALTQKYQEEEGKWNEKQYDNSTMIGIIDKYQPRYQEILDRAQALDTPERYKVARDKLIKAVETEMQSNEHFRNYLSSGNPDEYRKSIDLFSQSLQYSADYDAAMIAAG
ncbi:MAG: hypothetical protein ACREAQ_06930 [Nitrososphaera sp.]